ncbi:MAG: trigger factor [Bacillota bacterium]|nr:trigger factor [Bacillota bacterium]
MIIVDKNIKDGSLQVTLEIEKERLKQEGMDSCVPGAFREFLKLENLRIIGKPEVTGISETADGGLVFSVEAELYPEVTLGEYKGLHVAESREENEEAFAMAVLKKACDNMEGDVPDTMIDQKLDALIAQEKLKVSRDAIYHLLADTVEVLKQAYKETGVSRPAAQVRSEAMDIMLQTVSGDNQDPSRDYMKQQIRLLAEQYRPAPEGFDETLDQLFAKRDRKKSQMTAEELAAEAFDAYLGSIDLDQDKWRKQRRQEAAESARCDLLLEAVAEAEQIQLTEVDINGMLSRIAAECGMEVAEVMDQIDLEPIRSQLLRDKAYDLLLESAL